MHSIRRLLVSGVVSGLVAALVFAAPPVLAAGGGSAGGDYGGGSGSTQRSSRSPERIAKRNYQTGLRHKAKAWKLEEKAAREEDPEDREALLAKAQKAYARAIASQSAAVKADPDNYEARNELGYALRRTGKYDAALEAYDRVLDSNPTYYPAVEYRGEAYLALGRLDESKHAYMTLFRNDRKLAAQLLTAMDDWVAKQPEGDGRASFAAWVKERKALAAVGDDLSQNNERVW